MSRLRIYHDTDGVQPILITNDHAAIAHELAQINVRFERWQAIEAVHPGDSQEKIIAAYSADIERLKCEKGYQAVDVISLNPDHPDRIVLRQKFLNEHSHAEDEVRFFVAGQGQFTLHVDGKVYEILCVQGDLISVPDGTPHWFDMSESPYFIAIRLFTNKEGWVANFTGNDIAERFPRLPVTTAQAA